MRETEMFAESPIPAAVVFDACARLGVEARVAPAALQAIRPGDRVWGRAVPVRHYGSVDIFLRAMMGAAPGNVLVVDNRGRLDEACIGDLVVLEAKLAGLGGIVVWGAHRDSEELGAIDLPVFSCGRCPAGPRRLDAEEPGALISARIGDFDVGPEDFAIGDADGVVFVPTRDLPQICREAASIWRTERTQAAGIRKGTSLRQQLRFDEYLALRAVDPSYTLRAHLRSTGGAIEA